MRVPTSTYELRGVILCMSMLFASSIAAASQPAFNKGPLDRLLSGMARNEQLMGSLTITKNGLVQYSRVMGYRLIGDKEKALATATTGYRIGSISKMFTAALILQLVEEKKLTLASTLDQYFPAVPNASRITIKDLLTHRSGLSDIKEMPSFSSWAQQPRTRDEMLTAINSSSIRFEPGTKAEYNNSAYILLSYIIEQVCSQPYADVLQKRISSRIGLKHTYYATLKGTRPDESLSYRYENGWKASPETDWSIPAGAGGLVSTSGDMARFISALFKGEIVNRTSLDLMKSITDGYGMGMVAIPFGNRMSFGHDGQIDDFDCDLQYFPSDRVAMSYCSNGHVLNTKSVLTAIQSAYFGIPYTLPLRTRHDQHDLSKLSALLAIRDGQYFDAVFNTCDIPFVESLFSKTFVFYQDQGYTSATKSQSWEEFIGDIKTTCDQKRKGQGDRMRRDVPSKTLQLLPVNDHEVIQTGTQHFYIVKEGVNDQLVEESKFARNWRQKDGQWTMAWEIDYHYNTNLGASNGSTPPAETHSLYDEIAGLEGALVTAFNARNTEVLKKTIAVDAESYGSPGGVVIGNSLSDGAASLVNRSNSDTDLRMELVPGTLGVFPISNYGALGVGKHRVCGKANGQESCDDVSFVHIWRKRDVEWTLSTTIGYKDARRDTSEGAGKLFDTVMRMDSVLFDAFNNRDLDAMSSTFSTTLEFFQDNEGLENYQQTIDDFKIMFERNRDNGLRRDIVPGSIRVVPIEGYGAIELGEHRFCHSEAGKDDCGNFRFVNIWKDQGGDWKVTRAISYGH
jgi:D-alanyl-D-alanine carboxypeptidase